MKKYVLLSILLFCVGNLSATRILIESGDLPYTTANKHDTLYLSGDITTTGGGIIFNHDSIFVEGNGDSLFFGSDNGDNYNGLFFNGVHSGTRVSQLSVIHLGTYTPGGGGAENTLCISINAGFDIRFDSSNFYVGGKNGKVGYKASTAALWRNIIFYQCHLNSGANWYTTRMQYGGSIFWANGAGRDGTVGDTNIIFDGCRIDSTPGQGLVIQGSGYAYWCGDIDVSSLANCADSGCVGCDSITLPYLANSIIYNCTINTNPLNQEYEWGTYGSDSGPGPAGPSSANAYGTFLRAGGGFTEFYNNIITSGTFPGGGQGLELEDCLGTPTNWIKIYNNVIDVHGGINAEGTNGLLGWCNGLRIEDDAMHSGYIYVHDNIITATGDTSREGVAEYDLTPGYGYSANAFFLSATTDTGHIRIEHNWFKGLSRTGLTDSAMVTAILISGKNNDITLTGNRYTSHRVISNWGNVWPCSNFVSLSDTFELIEDSVNNDSFTVYMGNVSGGNNHRVDNQIVDATYLGLASEEMIGVGFSAGNEAEMYWGSTCTLTVKTGGVPVEAADVWIINAYGDTVSFGSTNANGLYITILNYAYDSLDFFGTGDSTYSPFTFYATEGGADTISTEESISNTLKTAALNFSEASGVRTRRMNNDE